MDQLTILADLSGPNYVVQDRKTNAFILSAKHAKVFIVDEATTMKLFGLVDEHRDLYESQRQFAKPPFDCTYVEFNPTGNSRSGVIRNGDMAMQVADLSDGKYRLSKSFIRVEDAGLRAVERPGLVSHEEEKVAAVQFVGLSEILWLLMHRPGVVKGPTGSRQTEGDPGKAAAHAGAQRPDH